MAGRFEGLDYLPVSIAVLDENGMITFVNRAWTEFSLANGYDGGDFVGVDYAGL